MLGLTIILGCTNDICTTRRRVGKAGISTRPLVTYFLRLCTRFEAWLANQGEHSYGHEDRSIRLEKHIMMGRLPPEVLHAWEYFLTTVHGKGIYRLVLTKKDLGEAFRRAKVIFDVVP